MELIIRNGFLRIKIPWYLVMKFIAFRLFFLMKGGGDFFWLILTCAMLQPKEKEKKKEKGCYVAKISEKGPFKKKLK